MKTYYFIAWMLIQTLINTATHAQVVPSQANVKLSQYGGLLGYPCTGVLANGNPIPGITGFYYLYKDTTLKHWLWCDPEGYRYYLTAVQVVDYGNAGYTSIANAKYGSAGTATSWQAIQARRMKDMGFNAVGEFSNAHMIPPPLDTNVNRLPYMINLNPAQYATHPSVGNVRLHDLYANLPPRWDVVDGYRAFAAIDLYDPKWTTLINTNLNLFYGGADSDPFLFSFIEDDIAWVSVLRSMQGSWIVGTTAPWVQYENSPQYSRKQVFSDPVMYSKQQWSTWLCGTRYANLAALNAAWGSTYSTCNSSATTAAAETIGTGNGVLTSFSYTFLHGPVDPASIGISVGGTLQGGDAPWFNGNCGTAVGTGCVQSSIGNISGGTVSYNSGGSACGGQPAPCITVTFSVAPANAVAITATYQYAGWPKATAGGTGLMDEDGTSAWWPQGDPVDNLVDYPDPAVTTIQKDMDAFLSLLAAKYYQPIRTNMAIAFPHHPLGSVDPVAVNARNSVLSVMAANTDFIFLSMNPSLSSDVTGATTIYNSYGEPIKNALYLAANTDSPYVASGPGGNDRSITQNDKGNFYSTSANTLFTTAGADGYGFSIGTEIWAWTDSSPEATNWGLVSENDNLYDGVESAAQASMVDPYGFKTTKETPIAQTGYLFATGDGVATNFNLPIKLLPIAPGSFSIVETTAAQTQSGSFSGSANPIGGNWTTVTGTSALQLVSGTVEGTATNSLNAAYNTAQSWPTGQYSECKIGGNSDIGSFGHCMVYVQAGAQSFYSCKNSDNRVLAIEKFTAGVETQVGGSTYSGTISANDVIRCEVTLVAGNPALVLKQNNTVRLSATDSASPFTSGNPGIGLKPNGTLSLTTLTDWHGGTITTVTGTDDSHGNVTGSGITSGTLSYNSPGTLNITYGSPVSNGSAITAAFTQNGFGAYLPSYVPSLRKQNALTKLKLASGTYSILSTNLALEKPAMFTSATETLAATQFQHANDGDITTSWQPTATNPQVYRVDLVGLPSVSKIILRWGAVYATAYTLDWSNDGLSWTTAFTQAAGAGGVETDTFTAVSHRYWRMNCTTRSGAGSLILQEMEIYNF